MNKSAKNFGPPVPDTLEQTTFSPASQRPANFSNFFG